jgi:hypothetical protein
LGTVSRFSKRLNKKFRYTKKLLNISINNL